MIRTLLPFDRINRDLNFKASWNHTGRRALLIKRLARKIIKTRGSFPNDDAALKLLYLAIKNAGLRWRRGIEWTAAMSQFAIQFGDRFQGAAR